VSAGFQNVHLRINDAATGKPTPVRIRIVGPDGQYYAPFGRLTEFATGPGEDVGGNLLLGGKEYAYIDGTCEIRLPVGDIDVEIHKGPEYRPVRQKVHLSQGKLALRFEIPRWVDLRSLGWFAGDVHCRFLSPHAALLEGAAEDLAVVNLLACDSALRARDGRDISFISNIHAFSGQRTVLETPGHLVVVNTFNYHRPLEGGLGTLALLNCHRVVHPLAFGRPDPFDEWNLADLCGQCHRKGGLVVSTSFFAEQQRQVGESLADILLGEIDVVEVTAGAAELRHGLKSWEDLLRCGLHVPLAGGSAKSCNAQLLGNARTYAQLLPGEEFAYKNWVEAVRAGRSFVTTGPFITFRANGQSPGSRLRLAPGATSPNAMEDALGIQAEAHSVAPFDRLEVIQNGDIVVAASAREENSIWTARLASENVRLPAKSGWLYARCGTPCSAGAAGDVGAVTSPIYVEVVDHPFQPDGTTIQALLARLERMQEWVKRNCRFASETASQRMLHIYRDAATVLR
jgi:hypothetical protein